MIRMSMMSYVSKLEGSEALPLAHILQYNEEELVEQFVVCCCSEEGLGRIIRWIYAMGSLVLRDEKTTRQLSCCKFLLPTGPGTPKNLFSVHDQPAYLIAIRKHCSENIQQPNTIITKITIMTLNKTKDNSKNLNNCNIPMGEGAEVGYVGGCLAGRVSSKLLFRFNKSFATLIS
jgi:hypothetical protein